MMNGIEILSVIENPIYMFNDRAFFITLVITFGILVILGIYYSYQENFCLYLILFCVIGVVIGMLFGIIVGCVTEIKTDEVKTSYKVLISDEVPLNEFLDKYEILDQEGKIYIIKERE